MTDAIKHEREAQGKQIAPHHFSNEADLINRLALGMTAAKFRVHHEIGKKEPIRDYLTPEQIHCITELQRANTVFISMGWDFEQRKEVLRGMFERNHRQPLIEEQHRGGLSYGNSFESHFHNGSPLQSPSTGGLDNET